MQIEEIKNEKLSKEYKVKFPYEQINTKIDKKIAEKAKTFKLAGFREGKVPLSLVKQKIGREITSQEVQEAIGGALKKIVDDKKISPSTKPNIEVESFDADKGLVFKIQFDILPQIPKIQWSDIEVDLVDVDVLEEDIQKMKDNLVKNMKDFKKRESKYKAKKGDALIINFVGKIDGKEFEGNKAEGLRIIIDSNYFIPGFEDQLVGVVPGESKEVKVTFPKDYYKKDLASKEAVFNVKVTEVFEAEGPDEVNDAILKKIGVKTVEELDEAVARKLNADFSTISRMRTKKMLFDQLDKNCNFDIPENMIELDFKNIWEEAKNNMEKKPELKNKPEEELKEDYKKLSKRRVKIGLILAEIAKENKITVTDAEVNKVIELQMSQNPDNKDKIQEFYQQPQNLEKIKAPIIEEKALDVILRKVKIKDVKVTSKEFNEKYSNDIKELTAR